MQGQEAQEIALSRSLWTRILAGLTAAVSLAGLTVEVLKWHLRWKGRTGVVPLLSLSYEQNVPTYFTAVLLVIAACLSALLAAGTPRGKRWEAVGWWGLAAGFLYISFDEVAEIHERWGEGIHTTGVLYFGWVIPAACVVAVVLALYVPFLRRLPRGARNWLLLSGAVYVLGAVGLELPLGYWTEREGQKNLGYALIDWVEETMEMAGIVLYLRAVFDLLRERGVLVRFGLPSRAVVVPAAEAPAEAPAEDAEER
ncbi:MAG: hypothetical protein R3B70_36365 [Polyangiaceae bacterium]